MLESHPARTPGVVVGYIFCLLLALFNLGLAIWLWMQPISLSTFVGGVLAVIGVPAFILTFYLTFCLHHAHYTVEGDALTINWGAFQQVIPLAQIRAIHPGYQLPAIQHFRGVRWWGYYLGQGELVDGSRTYPIRIFASRPIAQQVVLVTDARMVGLSPVEGETFADCLQALRKTIPTQAKSSSPTQPFVLSWAIWQDRTAHLCLIVPAILNLLLFAGITTFYPTFQPNQANHWLALPFIALLLWLLNSFLGWLFYEARQEKPIAYLIWGTTIFIQIAAWVGFLSYEL